ncbi:MAG: hypothetical protein SFW64_02760 [Alphaproteobacteria bacterium]|nr:hypothetical protein [Alphaproteobacteria bacterium]
MSESKTKTSDTSEKPKVDAPAAEEQSPAFKEGRAAGDALLKGATAAKEEVAPEADAPEGAAPEGGLARTKKAFSDFFAKGGVGKIIGGLLGIGGAWFLGSFFGGGVMSTILTIGLAIPLMMMGSSQLGGKINGLMGNAPEAKAAAEKSEAPAIARTREAVTQAAPGPVLTLSNEEMAAMVASVNHDRDASNDNRMGRVSVYVTEGPNGHALQARSVADSEAVAPGLITLEALRAMAQATAAGPIKGISFALVNNQNLRVTGATMRSLPNSPTGQGRR